MVCTSATLPSSSASWRDVLLAERLLHQNNDSALEDAVQLRSWLRSGCLCGVRHSNPIQTPSLARGASSLRNSVPNRRRVSLSAQTAIDLNQSKLLLICKTPCILTGSFVCAFVGGGIKQVPGGKGGSPPTARF